jgi:5'-methylthioinosine phosphorylase
MIAVIGGTGLSDPGLLGTHSARSIVTPYADNAVDIFISSRGGVDIAFLPRHGKDHLCPPHCINYRANLWALKEMGVKAVIAVNAVGGIHSNVGPGEIAVPEQIIDYTWGREHSYCDGRSGELLHVDFTRPYDEELRGILIASAEDLAIWPHGVYACTQGPRLESAAEVERIKRDGGDMIGMTGMPEAALARELGLAYASLAVSVNWAAGLSDTDITLEAIGRVLNSSMGKVLTLLDRAVLRGATYY